MLLPKMVITFTEFRLEIHTSLISTNLSFRNAVPFSSSRSQTAIGILKPANTPLLPKNAVVHQIVLGRVFRVIFQYVFQCDSSVPFDALWLFERFVRFGSVAFFVPTGVLLKRNKETRRYLLPAGIDFDLLSFSIRNSLTRSILGACISHEQSFPLHIVDLSHHAGNPVPIEIVICHPIGKCRPRSVLRYSTMAPPPFLF